MGNSGALKRRSHGSIADIATVQARSPKNGFTPGKIEALNLRLQTRPIQLNPWPTASRQSPKIPDRISERPPRGGLFVFAQRSREVSSWPEFCAATCVEVLNAPKRHNYCLLYTSPSPR